ncbi:FTR1 family protein [Neobacillus sp. 179-C4.2 HS]|uniref:FTR1 family protein n=1 Tax=Neobacillus driksii TaxID=3035913 RepID=A0ABV4YX28_9BACI|nr:FTR1 family protein [Neobacillus sp. 179.-C4.2 HS]MDP5195843.1 FTR1 family iron permease [Neobacillus sp. 179.-C4.2 HS]
MQMSWKPFILFLSLFIFFQTAHHVAAAENHDELFVLLGDSLMKVKSGDQETVSNNMEQFSKEWIKIKNTTSEQAKSVDQELEKVQSLLAKRNVEKETLSSSLSALSSSLVKYDKEQNPVDRTKQTVQVEKLLPLLEKLKESILDGDAANIKIQYQTLMDQWNASEKIVHDASIASYGNIERYTALIRISITQNPADLKKAETNVDKLTQEVENFLNGKFSKQAKGDFSLTDVSTLLKKAEEEIANKDYKSSTQDLDEILNIWPMVEGEVQTRDSKLYSEIETKIPTAISILSSDKVNGPKALAIVKDLNTKLEPLITKTNYSFWDSALILLREGLEGLLIIATLLAFLKKMGQSPQQKWIWIGVAGGILASALLAVLINIIFSKITAASSREYIEGIIGILAVVMMISVGAWLHKKSSIENWNKYVKQQMQQAIAKGSIFSFAVISFLSVFREGAETIIFYTGITPYISVQQLVIGIVLAVIILAILGFGIIYYSVKIPIHVFFKVATFVIYFLAFKMLGISIHALQVSKVFSTSTVMNFPFVDWIGLYPTWETTLPQLLLVVVIFIMTWVVRKQTITNNV